MNNTIKGNVAKKIWAETFERFTPKQRLEAFILVKMAEHGQTFHAIAKRHKMGAYYLGLMVHGDRPMTEQAIHALESDLRIDLKPFLPVV
jgi:hypothetical protein